MEHQSKDKMGETMKESYLYKEGYKATVELYDLLDRGFFKKPGWSVVLDKGATYLPTVTADYFGTPRMLDSKPTDHETFASSCKSSYSSYDNTNNKGENSHSSLKLGNASTLSDSFSIGTLKSGSHSYAGSYKPVPDLSDTHSVVDDVWSGIHSDTGINTGINRLYRSGASNVGDSKTMYDNDDFISMIDDTSAPSDLGFLKPLDSSSTYESIGISKPVSDRNTTEPDTGIGGKKPTWYMPCPSKYRVSWTDQIKHASDFTRYNKALACDLNKTYKIPSIDTRKQFTSLHQSMVHTLHDSKYYHPVSTVSSHRRRPGDSLSAQGIFPQKKAGLPSTTTKFTTVKGLPPQYPDVSSYSRNNSRPQLGENANGCTGYRNFNLKDTMTKRQQERDSPSRVGPLPFSPKWPLCNGDGMLSSAYLSNIPRFLPNLRISRNDSGTFQKARTRDVDMKHEVLFDVTDLENLQWKWKRELDRRVEGNCNQDLVLCTQVCVVCLHDRVIVACGNSYIQFVTKGGCQHFLQSNHFVEICVYSKLYLLEYFSSDKMFSKVKSITRWVKTIGRMW